MLLLGILTGGGLVSFLITILIIFVIIYIVKLLIDYLGLPDPIKKIAFIIIAVIALIYLLRAFGGGVV